MGGGGNIENKLSEKYLGNFPMAAGYDFSMEKAHQVAYENTKNDQTNKTKQKKHTSRYMFRKINNIKFKNEITDYFKEKKNRSWVKKQESDWIILIETVGKQKQNLQCNEI